MPRYHLAALYEERISPNGKWISGVVPEPVREGYIHQLFILDAATREVVLEFNEGWDASEPTWSDDTATFGLRFYTVKPHELQAEVDLAKRTAKLATMDPGRNPPQPTEICSFKRD